MAFGPVGALSLGPAQGKVLLGGPIDVSFEVDLDPGMELETACVAADVLLGDNLMGRGQVQLTLLPPSGGRAHAVRVQSTRQVDEPLLTVRLSAGCSGTVTRSYVFLVDLPESIAPSSTPIALPRIEPMSVLSAEPSPDLAPRPASSATTQPVRIAQASPAPLQKQAASLPSGDAPAPVLSRRVQPARPAKAPASQVRARAAKPPVAVASRPSGPRLVMEPLAVVLGPAASAASAAAAAPASAPQVAASAASAPVSAASAAATLGPAVPASQAEGAQDVPPQALKDELAVLREQAASDRAQALALQQRLERIESERFQPQVVFALLGVLLLMLAWMAWQMVRFRRLLKHTGRAWNASLIEHGNGPAQDRE